MLLPLPFACLCVCVLFIVSSGHNQDKECCLSLWLKTFLNESFVCSVKSKKRKQKKVDDCYMGICEIFHYLKTYCKIDRLFEWKTKKIPSYPCLNLDHFQMSFEVSLLTDLIRPTCKQDKNSPSILTWLTSNKFSSTV